MPWEAIKYVGSGLTLAAFIVAVVAWLIKTKSEERERLIHLAKDDERANLVRDALEFFSVDTTGLTKTQQYQLALEQIRERARRFKIIAVVVCILASLGTLVAVYAINRPTGDQKKAARAIAQQALTQLASVRFLGSPAYVFKHQQALNGLTLLGQIEADLRQGFVVGSNGNIPFTPADRAKALQKRDQAFNAIQTTYSEALEDWDAGAAAIRLTKSNSPTILRIEGLAGEGAVLAGQLPQLEGLERILMAGIAAGKGKLKDINLKSFDVDKNSDQIAFRLREAAPALSKLKKAWEDVLKRCYESLNQTNNAK